MGNAVSHCVGYTAHREPRVGDLWSFGDSMYSPVPKDVPVPSDAVWKLDGGCPSKLMTSGITVIFKTLSLVTFSITSQ